jgi:histidinol-phosphate aminotransferase
MAMVAAVDKNTRVVFIANPNNPTGTWVSLAGIETLLQRIPNDVIVLLDEAYYEYVDKDGYGSGISLIEKYPNLVVTRTFSKAYGLAALRVGYAVSSPEIADLLNRLRPPFNVTTLGLCAATAVLDDEQFIETSCQVNRDGMAQLEKGLAALGLNYIPSVGNFIAIEMPGNVNEIYQALLHKGVITRPIGVYEMPNHLRVTIGTEKENQKFLTALSEVLVKT